MRIYWIGKLLRNYFYCPQITRIYALRASVATQDFFKNCLQFYIIRKIRVIRGHQKKWRSHFRNILLNKTRTFGIRQIREIEFRVQ